MPDTTVSISVNGTPLGAADLDRVQSVSLEQGMGSRDMAGVVVSLLHDDHSSWSSPLDPLVDTSATPFTVSLHRGGSDVTVQAYSAQALWQITPGALSTVTVSGMDASVLLDREERTAPQEGTDSAVVSAIFARNSLTPGTVTPTTSNDAAFTPQQRATDWMFLQELARRNGFDVWAEVDAGVARWNFARVDPTRPVQGPPLDLAYGGLGGTPSAEVDLLAGRTVHVSRMVPGTTTTDSATDDGTSSAMGARSLGGWATVRADRADVSGEQDAGTTAAALAERWSFGATLSVTLSGPQMPLLRARRTVEVRGVGTILSGTWLVRTVSHTVTPGGHEQRLTLARNALGRAGGRGGGLLAGAAAAVGL